MLRSGSLLKHAKQMSKKQLILMITLFVTMGIIGYVLIAAHAGGVFMALEAEQGSGSGISTVSDNSASGSKAIQFDAAATLPTSSANLDSPVKKDLAMQLVSSAENSTLNWKAQYAYIEDIGDGRGYTGGIIGFCSGTGDMLVMIQKYTALAPGNTLAKYISALQKLDGSASHAGLDPNFVTDWKTAAKNPLFLQAQDFERDRIYFTPAVTQAKADGLGATGQFIYYDAIVQHGPGSQKPSFSWVRSQALLGAKTPAQGGDEKTYLTKFLDIRSNLLKNGAQWGWNDNSRVETEQRLFVNSGNFDLHRPLSWKVYGDSYSLQ